MKIKTIIFGATGMVGEGVLHESLKHEDVESVLVIGRRPCNVEHPKLKEIVHRDFFDYSSIAGQLKGYNACFFCLGVSSLGKKEDEYRRITYDLTLETARTLSNLNPDMTFCYVSGAGTDSSEKGKIMWARVKGKTENDLTELSFKKVFLFRPGLIKPIKGLKHAFTLAKAAGALYPVWKLLFPRYVCTLEDVGRAMIHAAAQGYSKNIIECKDIAILAGSGDNSDEKTA
ncbi:MAG: epimerase [Bacteroidota bacterium]